jgi:dTDP-4-dehydrorhamnose 3,5-epimerase-like enzyme
MKVEKLKFNHFVDEDGGLVPIESGRDVPFAFNRVYYIHGVGPDVRRGFHAHHQLPQVLICAAGSCKVLLDNGREKVEVELNQVNEGLIVGPMVWHEMLDFSGDCVLLVLARDHYDEADYIRNYDEFQSLVNEESHG